MPESLGRRIAGQRSKLGWTQQELALRVAVSRVAVSLIETSMSDPSERTIALLATVFKVEPHELVAGTAYPQARAERLPLVVATYTEVEHQLGLLACDLEWCEIVDDRTAHARLQPWAGRLSVLLERTFDRRERDAVVDAATRVKGELGRW